MFQFDILKDHPFASYQCRYKLFIFHIICF
ncbi:hypothetical protein F4Z99_08530 [Candidatus Poribacteria bacterium]|nr:hypothetical protein [Candidatus Poribacteria bacterium]